MNEKRIPKLTIQEINKETTLSVIASLEDKKLELPVEYAHITDNELVEIRAKYGENIIPIEDVVQEWKRKLFKVSFNGHLSKLDLMAINTEGVFLWEKVKIYKVVLSSGRMVNLIKSDRVEGEKFNRRRGVRIALDKSMDIQQDGEIFRVVVRDLSYCGVGFIEYTETSNIKVGEPFELFLVEDSKDGENLVGKFYGKVINQRELPAGGIFNGCILSSQHSTFLQRYIAMKQLEQISGKKMSPTIQRNATGDNWKGIIVESLAEKKNE